MSQKPAMNSNDYPDLESARARMRELEGELSRQHDLAARLQRRNDYEAGLARCSKLLIQAEWFAFDQVLENLLFTSEVSRVYYFENYEDQSGMLRMRQTHEVCAAGVDPQIDNPELLSLPYHPQFERWQRELSAGRPIAGRVESFPESERRILLDQDIVALLVIPVVVNHEWRGFIGFDETRIDRVWREADVRLLATAAEMIGAWMYRLELKERAEHDRLLYERFVSESPDAVVLCNSDGSIIGWNPAARNLFGLAAAEVVGTDFMELAERVDPDGAAAGRHRVASSALLASAWRSRSEEWNLRKPDGTSRTVHSRVFRIPVDGDTVYASVTRDVSERARLAAQLRERDERYALATRAGRLGVWEWQINSGDFYLDPNVKELLGYRDEEIPN